MRKEWALRALAFLAAAMLLIGCGKQQAFVFADLDPQVYADAQSDASSPFYHAVPAVFVEGFGAMCSLSDVVTYGGDPADFTRTDERVANSGQVDASGDTSSGPAYVFYAHN